MRPYAVVAALAFLALSTLEAQGFCLRPRPKPHCSVSTITEIGPTLRVAATKNQQLSVGATANYGLTYYVDSRYAIGGFVTVALQEGEGAGNLVALKFRGRAWLTPKLTVDVSPGLIISGVDGWSEFEESGTTQTFRFFVPASTGFTVDAGIGLHDWVGAFVRADFMRYTAIREDRFTLDPATGAFMFDGTVTKAESGSITQAMLGVRAGSVPGMVLSLATPVIVGAIFVIVCAGGACSN